MTLPEASQPLVSAIAQLWPDLPELISTDWEAFESAVLTRLRRLDIAEQEYADAADDGSLTAAEDEVEAAEVELLDFFAPHPVAAGRLNHLYAQAIQVAGVGTRHGPGHPATHLVGSVRYHRYLEVPVYFATDRRTRARSHADRAGEWYTGERSDGGLSYGLAKVSIPDRRPKGRLPKPKLWHVGFDPGRHVAILSVEPMPAGALVASIRQVVRDHRGRDVDQGAVDEHDVLVFIHGFNVSFVSAVRRAAQLAYDLDFPGVPMLYSWPSGGRALPSVGSGLPYHADRENARWGVEHFVDFLRLVISQLRPRQVHAIAHSMGNQVLIEGLDRLARDADARLGQVVSVAADFDAGLFERMAGVFGGRVVRFTVYVSKSDRALWLSERLSGHTRVGRGSNEPATVAGVDTIDASTLKGGLMSHSVFAENPLFLNDLTDLVRYGRPPAQRAGIRRVNHPNGSTYWAFPAS